MQNFTYQCLHIPTGRQYSRSGFFESFANLYEFLNRCNQSNPGTWQYWA